MNGYTTRRRGFSLIEILCVIALLAVLGGIMAYMLKQTFDVERLQAKSFDQMLQSNTLADAFRADVADAITALMEWKDYKAGAQTLILQRKDGAHVVYVWHEKKLQRLLFERDVKTERQLSVDATRFVVEFAHDTAKSKIVRMRLLAHREGKAASGQALEIAAALGGDWR